MKALDDLGLAENTLVIFSSDNGGVGNVTYNAPLRAGKGSLYEGGIRVATCMRWPRVVKAGSQCNTPVTSVDFLPTLADLAGAALPASQPYDGKSFAPLLRGEKALSERAIYWHYPLYLAGNNRTNFVPYRGGERLKGAGWRITPSGAVREGDWKLVEFFEDGNYELYNIRQDPGESNNLARKMPGKAQELLRKLHAWRKSVNAPVPKTPNPAWDGS
jgi:arylsulfatase A-like enzyme